jgi:hypothetical protein
VQAAFIVESRESPTGGMEWNGCIVHRELIAEGYWNQQLEAKGNAYQDLWPLVYNHA